MHFFSHLTVRPRLSRVCVPYSVGDFAQRTQQSQNEEEQQEKGPHGHDQPEGRRPFDNVSCLLYKCNGRRIEYLCFIYCVYSEEKVENRKEYVEPTASTPSASPANVSNISTAAQSGDVPQDDVDEDGYSIKPKWEVQTIKKGKCFLNFKIDVFF